MKNLSALMKCHLAAMVVMMLGTFGAIVNFVVGFVNTANGKEKLSNGMNILLMIIILCMLVVGVLYLLKDYNKQAAVYYKWFLIINILVCILTVIIDLFFYQVTTMMILISILNICKVILLCLLAFRKDLGEKNTWTLFYILLAVDALKLVFAVINMSAIGFDFSFAGYVTALLSDGTIGLAIRGKYDNKKARGRLV